jgi:hypothetical protein
MAIFERSVDGINLTFGNRIAMGFRVGDVFRANGLPDAADNGRNLRIAALSAAKITTAEQLTANAVADTTLGSVDPSAFTKRGGPRTETIAFPLHWSARRPTRQTVSIRP